MVKRKPGDIFMGVGSLGSAPFGRSGNRNYGVSNLLGCAVRDRNQPTNFVRAVGGACVWKPGRHIALCHGRNRGLPHIIDGHNSFQPRMETVHSFCDRW